MTYLEIDFGSGDRRTVELDRFQPVSIGRHPSNDVAISGENVEPMHCRISWQKPGGFQVVAAGRDGVDVNGTLVRKATLVPDDVLRIGPANITFRDASASPPETADFKARDAESSTFSLKPLSSEIDFPLPPDEEDLPPLTADEIIADEPVESADEIITGDAIEEKSHRRGRKSRSRESRGRKAGQSAPQREEIEQHGRAKADHRPGTPAGSPAAGGEHSGKRPEDRPLPRPGLAAHEVPEESGTGVERSARASLRERFRPRPQRPGDRDAARSPFVLTLGGGALALLLTGATFYFMLGRQTTQTRFNAAQSLMEEGKYAQAITAFEDFLALHPRDALAEAADVQRWIARIERQISGASPDWEQGLSELHGMISARRDAENFAELHDAIRKRAERIAEGAATTAGKTNDRTLLTVSDDAANLLTIYSPQEAPPTDALKRIESARRTSEAAILKHEAFVAAVSEMDAALRQKQTLAALDARRRLLLRYPDFDADATIAAKLDETLEVERKLVVPDDSGAAARRDDHESAFPPPLSLTFHARSRTDEVSEKQTVFAIAADCCYAVDSITGEPIWRRVIGWDGPFFPEPVSVDGPALLVFDTRHDELALLDQRTGALQWRQPAVSGVVGRPLVDEGQAYLAGGDGTLSKVDLETGQLIARLRFSQPISSAEALNDGARIVVCGEQEVLYTLSKRPLECVAVSYLGHKPQSITSPLLAMGSLLLAAENQPGERTLLHVLECRSEDDRLPERAKSVIPGHVVDRSVIRGRDLFVPSSGERISSFAVSDEEGQPPLTEGPRYEAQGQQQSPVFLATGPDRQVWMAGRQLRKLRLTADALEPGQQLVNLGTATQPLQQLGPRIYVGRRTAFSSAVTLFQVDRDQLASQWQTVLGGRLLAISSLRDQSGFVAVSEAGDVFRVSDRRLDSGGFFTETSVRLKVPEGLASPLGAAAVADGQLVVWCGAPEPQLWFINRLGQIDRNPPLPEALEAAPVPLGSRLALPLAGRISLAAQGGGPSGVQDFTLPRGSAAPSAWRQLVSVEESTLLAVTASGTLRLIRVQEAPPPHLAEAGQIEIGAPIDHHVAVGDGRIGLAVGTRLQLINVAGLEPSDDAELPGPVSNDVWFAGGCLYVETGRTALHCYDVEPELRFRWTAPLPQVSLASAPYVTDDQESVVVALRDGAIFHLSAGSGEIINQRSCRQSLSGLLAIGSGIVATTTEGSLIRVESILNPPGSPSH